MLYFTGACFLLRCFPELNYRSSKVSRHVKAKYFGVFFMFLTGLPPLGAFLHKLVLLVFVVLKEDPHMLVFLCVVNGLMAVILMKGAYRAFGGRKEYDNEKSGTIDISCSLLSYVFLLWVFSLTVVCLTISEWWSLGIPDNTKWYEPHAQLSSDFQMGVFYFLQRFLWYIIPLQENVIFFVRVLLFTKVLAVV